MVCQSFKSSWGRYFVDWLVGWRGGVNPGKFIFFLTSYLSLHQFMHRLYHSGDYSVSFPSLNNFNRRQKNPYTRDYQKVRRLMR